VKEVPRGLVPEEVIGSGVPSRVRYSMSLEGREKDDLAETVFPLVRHPWGGEFGHGERPEKGILG